MLVWALVISAAWIGLFALSFLIGWPVVGPIIEASWNGRPMGWSDLAPRIPAMILVELVVLTAYAMLLGLTLNAIARAILRPDERRMAYLRFGVEEVRTGAAYLLLTLLGFGVVAILAGIVFGLYLLTGNVTVVPIAAPLAMLVAWGAWIWGAVRLSLLLPMTLDLGRIDLRGAWRFSRGLFWPLLGLGVLAYILSFLVSLLAQPLMFLFMPGIFAAMPMEAGAALEPREFFHRVAPYMAGMIVLTMPFAVLQMVVIYAPFVAAYRALSATGPGSDAAPTVPAG